MQGVHGGQRVAARLAMMAALAASAAACGGDGGDDDDDSPERSGHFVAMRIMADRHFDDRGEVAVQLYGADLEPCPSLAEPIEIRANNATGTVSWPGGLTSDDPMFATCGDAMLVVEDVPFGDHLTVRMESPGLTVEVEWDEEHRLWSDDDIRAAMETREPFTVSWIPEDVALPMLYLHADGHALEDPAIVLDESGPGWARYHFEGAEPPELWSLVGSSDIPDVVLEPCPLEDSCRLDSYAQLFVAPP